MPWTAKDAYRHTKIANTPLLQRRGARRKLRIKRTATTPVPFVQQTPLLRAALTLAHRAGV